MKRFVAGLLSSVVVLTAGLLGSGVAGASPARTAAPVGDGEVGVQATVWWCDGSAWCTQTITNLNLRAQASTSSAVVTTMPNGATFRLLCWVRGQSIGGDNVWYWGVHNVYDGGNPAYWPTGYAAGYYLDTGSDPNAHIPAC